MNIVLLRRKKLGHTSCKGISEFSKNNVKVIRNDKELLENPDVLVRWGCTSQYPAKKTLNKTEAIHLVNDKLATRKMLLENGIETPNLVNNLLGSEPVKYPIIIRPIKHSQGKNLFFCNNYLEAKEAVNKINGEFYASEYIPKDREFGVFVFQNRVTSVIEKVPKTENANESIAWNVAQGTHFFENVPWSEWNIQVATLALKAMKVVNLDFGRVDIIVKDGKPFVLEINSAHSLTSEYRQEVFAKCLDYFVEIGTPEKEINFENVGTYKSIIHPALRVNKQGINL